MRDAVVFVCLLAGCGMRAPSKEAASPRAMPGAVEATGGDVRREHAPPLAAADATVRPRSDFRETIYWNASLQTDADGVARVTFPINDSITSFRTIAEGIGAGRPGHGEVIIQSKLPVSIAAQIPVEVTRGDVIRIPVTITNTTAAAREAIVEASLGPAFQLRSGASPTKLTIGANRSRSLYYTAEVVGLGATPADGRVTLRVASGTNEDLLERTIRVAPPGFPGELAAAGTLEGTATHELELPEVVPGTLDATLRLYPSTTATLVAGTEALVREPGGCFEQASSTNYPNVMVLGYLGEHDALEPELVARSRRALDRGYQLLVGYESPTKGYEWFGGDPGHEALTAYGLMEFADMSKVYPKLDREMVRRTAAWLKGRRDGKGGFQRNQRALDSFGRASAEVTDAYVTWALSEVGERDLAPELERTRRLAAETKDPYLLALAALALANLDPAGDTTSRARERLAAMQAPDGSFPGAAQSITMSGGEALAIESTSLAALALMKDAARARIVSRAIDWIAGKRTAFGGFYSTQATVLALKALTAHAEQGRALPAGARVTVVVNGTELGPIAVEADGSEGISVPGLAEHLRPGKNEISLVGSKGLRLPYSIGVTWRTEKPASSPLAPVDLETRLSRTKVRAGDPVRLHARISTTSDKGLPMVIARIGIPGGLAYQPWQLEELRKRGKVDFVETREREVIVYFRQLAPREARDVDLELLAATPGSYTSPASSAYLYYTDEHKRWDDPTVITVERRPVAKKKKKPAVAPPPATQEVPHATP